MDIPGSVFVERHRFQKDIVNAGTLLLYVNQLEQFLVVFENIGVALLTDLTFKFLPVI